jgi:hypothetical protein
MMIRIYNELLYQISEDITCHHAIHTPTSFDRSLITVSILMAIKDEVIKASRTADTDATACHRCLPKAG